ncbi:MAG: CBS domain-containing protein [Candidatus Latescibacteria bacterium]|nr:CBS domain-containing protein [Candidatus Latescibacterota bacterium]
MKTQERQAGAKRAMQSGVGLLEPVHGLHVSDLMVRNVESCTPASDLTAAAMVMWRRDCGIVPVIDEPGERTVGVITDRDICMAVATRGRPASQISVGEVMSHEVFCCRPEDTLVSALDAMRTSKVRRLPVTDAEGRLRGMLSLNDVVIHTRALDSGRDAEPRVADVIQTLRAISEHRQAA